MKANDICAKAADLVGGDRAAQHGDKVRNHQNIAALWNAYLGWRLGDGCLLTPKDVALMMALLKIARTKCGADNPDDYVDLAGYAGCAGEIATETIASRAYADMVRDESAAEAPARTPVYEPPRPMTPFEQMGIANRFIDGD